MFVVCVRVQVVPGREDEFVEASRGNAQGARSEPGNLRFDVLRSNDDPSRFFLYEVYRDEQAFKDHQQTAHYVAWKERVAPMMAVPRVGDKHTSVLPDPWE